MKRRRLSRNSTPLHRHRATFNVWQCGASATSTTTSITRTSLKASTLKRLQNEREVQVWVANELRARKGRAYTGEREPHVVEEKEPDIRLQASGSDASLPIEIKVAESWSTYRT